MRTSDVGARRVITAAAGPRRSPTSTTSGDYVVKRSGVSLSRRHVRGSLYITGSDVTVSDVVVDGNVYVNFTPQGGLVEPVPSDVRLVHVRATGIFSNGFRGLTLDGVELVDQQDGPHAQLFNYADDAHGAVFPASRLVITRSWFHGVRPSTTEAHLENLHLGGVQGAVIRDNVFELYSPNGGGTQTQFTANVALEPQMYGVFNSDVVFDGNWLLGGGAYQLYFNAKGTNRVTNNHFASDSPSFAAVQYPPDAYVPDALPPGGYVAFAQSGNTLDGQPTDLPGGK